MKKFKIQHAELQQIRFEQDDTFINRMLKNEGFDLDKNITRLEENSGMVSVFVQE